MRKKAKAKMMKRRRKRAKAHREWLVGRRWRRGRTRDERVVIITLVNLLITTNLQSTTADNDATIPTKLIY